MAAGKRAESKPLSFSTTMRNPYRIANYLKCLAPFENQILSHEIIMKIIQNAIKYKVYKPYYIDRTPKLKNIFKNEESFFTNQEIFEIIEHSPQDHKEAGFEHGWESRFDTIFKLPMEFGYIYYAKNESLKISETGHMLIDALNENPVNEQKIQNVFLNSHIKYQIDNPFRKNANSNVPLILLLQVIDLLKNDLNENGAGVFIQELSLLICWPNNNAKALYDKIKSIRKKNRFMYSDEYMYDICLDLLGADDTKRDRFKMSQICNEAVDEYVRKMRSTGIISLRGNGRFLDFNSLEMEKIKYILRNYSNYNKYEDKLSYYKHMGCVDPYILSIPVLAQDVSDVRKSALSRFANTYSETVILEELKKLCGKRTNSEDKLLKYIPAPTRLEFLTSIALLQQFENLNVSPNYICDDEGIPTCTASGGMADIVCTDAHYNSLIEVTLMCGRADQINNEMIPIKRHLEEAVRENTNTFSVFIAPIIHADVIEYIDFNNHQNKNRSEPLNIVAFDIKNFISNIQKCNEVSQLLIP